MIEIADNDYRQLQDAREIAESTINAVHEPLIILDGELKVVSASRSFYQVFKVNPAETERQFIYELGNSQWDIPALRKLLEEIIPGNESFDNYEVEHEFPVIGKRTMLLNARRIPRPPAKPRVILLAIEDVTASKQVAERKRLHEELCQSEDKFSKAFQTSPYAITITRAADGQFIDVNDAFISITGFSREEALAGSSVGLKLWANEAERQRVVAELSAGRAVVGREYQFRTKSGRVITGLFSAQTIQLSQGAGILSSIDDITKRKEAENALAETMEQLKLVNGVAIGNELKVIEREKEVNLLLAELGREPKYK
ncbi:MAG: PAS domain S-box protein [Candidatus Margulisiibacteriota bacterium]